MDFWEQCDRVIERLPTLMPKLFQIRTKDEAIRLLTPNAMQRHYHRTCVERGARRIINAKARQLGFSTWTELEGLALAMFVEGFSGAIISHEREATRRLMSIVSLAYDHLPAEYQPNLEHDRQDYLTFKDRSSRLYVGTAGQRKFGRGDTIHWLHISEMAHYPEADELMLGLGEAVPKRGYVRIESSPNGREYFYETFAQAKQQGYEPFFYPWWWEPDYKEEVVGELVPTEEEMVVMARAKEGGFELSLEQLQWRRNKMARLGRKFRQEYPEDSVTCFLSSGNAAFDPEMIAELAMSQLQPVRKEEQRPGSILRTWFAPGVGHTYAIGVDPSRGLPRGDEFGMAVVDAKTGRHVASQTGLLPPYQLAEQAAKLGKRYDNALIAVERQGGGEAVLQALQHQLDYKNIYLQPARWKDESNVQGAVPGWYTTVQAKERMVSEFARALECGDFQTWDNRVYDQAANVLRDVAGRLYTVKGRDDHLLMACMIANMVMGQAGRAGRQRVFDYSGVM